MPRLSKGFLSSFTINSFNGLLMGNKKYIKLFAREFSTVYSFPSSKAYLSTALTPYPANCPAAVARRGCLTLLLFSLSHFPHSRFRVRNFEFSVGFEFWTSDGAPIGFARVDDVTKKNII